jgi:hypothetical protein
VNNGFVNLIIKLNGVDQNYSGVVGAIGNNDTAFEPGEQIYLNVASLTAGNSIAVVYAPTGDVLQRVMVT